MDIRILQITAKIESISDNYKVSLRDYTNKRDVTTNDDDLLNRSWLIKMAMDGKLKVGDVVKLVYPEFVGLSGVTGSTPCRLFSQPNV